MSDATGGMPPKRDVNTIDYLAKMSFELARLAKSQELVLLEHLLMMAAIEALDRYKAHGSKR